MSGRCSRTTSWWRKQILWRRPQDCLSRVKGEDQKVGDPKGVQRLLAVSLDTFARNQDISRQIVWNSKRCWREMAVKILMGLVPVESQIKPELLKKQIRIHVMSWRLSQKKVNTQMLSYLTRSAHTTCAKTEVVQYLLAFWWRLCPNGKWCRV